MSPHTPYGFTGNAGGLKIQHEQHNALTVTQLIVWKLWKNAYHNFSEPNVTSSNRFF